MEHRSGGPLHYLEVTFHYYALGRHAVHCGFVPVAANVLHHAAEMALKFQFVRCYNIDQLRQKLCPLPKKTHWDDPIRNLKHELNDRIWPAFKSEFPNLVAPDLSKHDSFIRKLDRWEDIRYPSVTPEKTTQIPTIRGPVAEHILDNIGIPAEERYEIDLEEADYFFYTIMTLQDIAGTWARYWLDDSSYPMYLRNNKYPLPGAPKSVTNVEDVYRWGSRPWLDATQTQIGIPPQPSEG